MTGIVTKSVLNQTPEQPYLRATSSNKLIELFNKRTEKTRWETPFVNENKYGVYFCNLPSEITAHILSFLDKPSDLLKMALVSTVFFRLVHFVPLKNKVTAELQAQKQSWLAAFGNYAILQDFFPEPEKITQITLGKRKIPSNKDFDDYGVPILKWEENGSKNIAINVQYTKNSLKQRSIIRFDLRDSNLYYPSFRYRNDVLTCQDLTALCFNWAFNNEQVVPWLTELVNNKKVPSNGFVVGVYYNPPPNFGILAIWDPKEQT